MDKSIAIRERNHCLTISEVLKNKLEQDSSQHTKLQAPKNQWQ